MKKLMMIVVVLAFAGVVSANGITSGAWEDPGNWWDGHTPIPADGLLYVGPGGTTGTNYVTVTTNVPQVQNEVYFSDINLDITGVLDIASPTNFIWAGAYGPTVINVSGSGYFKAGPDTFALDGRDYSTTINLSGNGAMDTIWPHFYAGDLQINLTDDALWRTQGMWFTDTDTVYPTPGGAYNLDISGTATFMVSNLWWSEADALAAIAGGFITGDNLQVSTSVDTYYTVVTTPEPMTMSLLGLGSLIVIKRKRA